MTPRLLQRLFGFLSGLFLIAFVFLYQPTKAQAQYKNSQWSIGVTFPVFPGSNLNFYDQVRYLNDANYKGYDIDSAGRIIGSNKFTSVTAAPYGIVGGLLQFHYAFKIDLERWFLRTAVSVGGVSLVSTDVRGYYNVGLMVDGAFGARVYFLTDKFRPFAELGVRIGGVPAGGSQFIPTGFKVIGGLYAMMGMEFIVYRDIALSLDLKYSIIIQPGILNRYSLDIIEPSLGVVFYF